MIKVHDMDFGFSIEIKNVCLRDIGKHENYPLYEVTWGSITSIAIVSYPAIEVNCKLVADHQNESLTIYGIVMRPDFPIYRDIGKNGKKEDCYWTFTKKIVDKCQADFNNLIENYSISDLIKLGHNKEK